MNIKPDMNTMKGIAYQINSKPLAQFPISNSSGPSLLLPQIENSLLKNNYHIFSEEILRKMKEGELKQPIKEKKEKGKRNNLTRKRVSLMRSNHEDETPVNKKSLIEETKDEEKSHIENDQTIVKSNIDEEEDDENNDLNLNLPLVEDDYDF